MQNSTSPECIVIGCYNSQHNTSARYYNVPIEDDDITKQWYSNTLREDLNPQSNHYVCHEHFDNDSYEDDLRCLKLNAIPSLFELEVFHKMLEHQDSAIATHSKSQLDIPDSEYNSTPWSNDLLENKSVLINKPPPGQRVDGNLKVLKCQIMGCPNHYMPKKEAVPLYNLPRDCILAKRWLKSCNREDVQFNSYTRFKICSEHFLREDFNEDGTLTPTAVPTLFSDRSMDMQTQLRDLNFKRRSENILAEDVYSIQLEDGDSPKTISPFEQDEATVSTILDDSDKFKKEEDILPTDISDPVKTSRDLNMTCEDDRLSHSQILAFKAKMFSDANVFNMAVAEGVSLDWMIEQNVHGEEFKSKEFDDDRYRGSNIIRTGGRDSILQSVKRPRRRKNVQKLTQYLRPIPPAKASIPFLEPAFRDHIQIYSKNLCVPRLKPGAVRTREEGLEVHLERTFRLTLKKYYDRKWACPDIRHHMSPIPCRCSICHDQVPDNIALTLHLCQHIEKGDGIDVEADLFGYALSQTVCTRCLQNFNTPFELIMHYDTHHIHEIKEYQCRICEQKHGSMLELAAHLNLCHCGLEMPYRCEECEFRTSFYMDALYHIATQHRGESRFFCPFCLKTLIMPQVPSSVSALCNSATAYTHLIQHYNKVDGTKVTASKCKHCRKCVLHLRMIKDHIRRDHPNIVAGAKASYFSDDDEADERYLIASGAITAIVDSAIIDDQTGGPIIDDGLNSSIAGQIQTIGNDHDSIATADPKSRKRKRCTATDLTDLDYIDNLDSLLQPRDKPPRRTRGRPRKLRDDQIVFEPFADDEDSNLLDPINTVFDSYSSIPSPNETFMAMVQPMKLRCIECGKLLCINDINHFRTSRRCAFCPYLSSCSAAFSVHEHGHHEQTLYTLGECPPRPHFLFQCVACNLETVDADLMAFHMATACVNGQPSDNSLAGSVESAIDARAQCPDCAHKCFCISLGM